MKKSIIKVLSVVLVVVITLASAPLSRLVGLELPKWFDFSINASAATSGTCGENLIWTFDESTGTLTISGTGSMEDFTSRNSPWQSYENNIEKVFIDNGVTAIGDNAFWCCYNLESVIIPDGLISIGDCVFVSCYKLVNIVIPNSVTTIGKCAFSGCESLKNIIVDSNNQYYSSDEDGVLFNKDKTVLIQYPLGSTRTSYTIPDSVITISNRAFACSNNLTSVFIGNAVSTIDVAVFAYCDNLTSVTISNSVTIIDRHVFDHCSSLKYVYYLDTKTKWEKISIGSNNSDLINATIYYHSDSHNYDTFVVSSTCTDQGYTKYICSICGDSYVGDYTDPLGHDFKNGTCTECNATDPDYFIFSIQEPSTKRIRCRDGIVLHTNIVGTLPQGSRIEWTSSNNNFSVEKSDSGNEITIISKNNGYTTFTATVYDADNNVIAQDTIEMYSKAGFFDKIGGFFRSIFGMTKIYEK